MAGLLCTADDVFLQALEFVRSVCVVWLGAGLAARTALVKHAVAGLMHDARSDLHRITADTLVLAGECDDLLGTALPRALAKEIPNATFEVIEHSGHDITLEQPVTSAKQVTRFLVH